MDAWRLGSHSNFQSPSSCISFCILFFSIRSLSLTQDRQDLFFSTRRLWATFLQEPKVCSIVRREATAHLQVSSSLLSAFLWATLQYLAKSLQNLKSKHLNATYCQSTGKRLGKCLAKFPTNAFCWYCIQSHLLGTCHATFRLVSLVVWCQQDVAPQCRPLPRSSFKVMNPWIRFPRKWFKWKEVSRFMIKVAIAVVMLISFRFHSV